LQFSCSHSSFRLHVHGYMATHMKRNQTRRHGGVSTHRCCLCSVRTYRPCNFGRHLRRGGGGSSSASSVVPFAFSKTQQTPELLRFPQPVGCPPRWQRPLRDLCSLASYPRSWPSSWRSWAIFCRCCCWHDYCSFFGGCNNSSTCSNFFPSSSSSSSNSMISQHLPSCHPSCLLSLQPCRPYLLCGSSCSSCSSSGSSKSSNKICLSLWRLYPWT